MPKCLRNAIQATNTQPSHHKSKAFLSNKLFSSKSISTDRCASPSFPVLSFPPHSLTPPKKNSHPNLTSIHSTPPTDHPPALHCCYPAAAGSGSSWDQQHTLPAH